MKNEKNKLIKLLKVGILLFGVSVFLWNCEKDSFVQTNTDALTTQQKLEEITNDPLFDILSLNVLRIKFYVYKTGLSYQQLKDFSTNEGDVKTYRYIIEKTGIKKSDVVYDIRMLSKLFNRINNSHPVDCELGQLLRVTLLTSINSRSKAILEDQKKRFLEAKKTYNKKLDLGISECESNKDCPVDKLCCRIFGTTVTLKCVDAIIEYDSITGEEKEKTCPLFAGELEEVIIEGNKKDDDNDDDGFWWPTNWGYPNNLNETDDWPYYNPNDDNQWENGGDNYYPPLPPVVDDKIDASNLTGKAKCAYEKLLSSGISNFHNMITDLFIEFGDNNVGGRDLTFKMSSDLPNNIGGKTKYYGNGKYGILINKNLMNTLSSIEVAAILVHEIAHAFLGKHYNDSNSSFKELYKKYINDTKIANYSHDIMRDQFINRMAIALRNYDRSIFSSFDDYKILASQGVFELTDNQEDDLLVVKLISRNNDKNCD